MCINLRSPNSALFQPISADSTGAHDHFAHVNLCALSLCPVDNGCIFIAFGCRTPRLTSTVGFGFLSFCAKAQWPNLAPGYNGYFIFNG